MQIQSIPSSSSFHHINTHRYPIINSSWTNGSHQTRNSTPFYRHRSNIYHYAYTTCQFQGENSQLKGTLKKQSKVDPIAVSGTKKGTVAGAVALIIGTSIGTGILALPQKTSPVGLVPSSISLTLCWGFLLIEALLLVEINVGLLKKKKKRVGNENENELEVISIRTMAQETLGELGGTLATLTYVFLGYTSVIAYAANLVKFFTIWLTFRNRFPGFSSQCCLRFSYPLEVLAILLGGWSGFEGNGDWTKVPATVPVMIFSLVYHDLAPVLCAYLGGDIGRIRTSVILGSVVPLIGLLVWNAIALSFSSHAESLIDPVELLMRQKWNGGEIMVEAFSLLAVGTSLIGTLLSFSQFFREQIVNNLTWDSSSASQAKSTIYRL
ncbi:putative amino acid/polyamine transporter 2 [Helianthus annuus]|nr:putative amino acid/polyamine transporter 2 [Helianthus annuus]